MADPNFSNQITTLIPPLPSSTDWLKTPASSYRNMDEVGSNLGEKDSRRPVLMGEKEFDSVVVLNGDQCTGTISTIEGYNAKEGGSIIVTAAHCVDGYEQDGISISGSYLDEQGLVKTYEMQSQEIWMHPHYLEQLEHGHLNPDQADVAIIYTSEPSPQAIVPAEFQTLDIMAGIAEHQEEAEAGIVEENPNPNALKMSVVGYSADNTGLSVHDAANIQGVDGQLFISDADTAGGASGGPNYGVAEDGSIELSDTGQPVFFAVTSSGINNEDTAYSVSLKEEFLSSAKFLESEEAPIAKCDKEQVVTSDSGVNRRYGPGTEYDTMVRAPETGVPSALPQGSEVDVLSAGHGAEENWSLVQGEDGRMGYINDDYIEPVQSCDSSLKETGSVDLGSFAGSDAEYGGDAGLGQEAVQAGVAANISGNTLAAREMSNTSQLGLG